MTGDRPKPAKKSGSRKGTGLPQDPRSSFSLLSKHKIWIATALAAVIVVAIGLGYQLLNGSTRNMASASAATFVGSETCAGCHQARSEAVARLAAPARDGSMRPTNRCSAISAMRRFEYYGVDRASSAGTASSSSRPTGPTASSPRSRSSTRSASIRCSNIWSSFPTGACRRSRSPGTAGRRTRAVSAGSISIRTRRSGTTTCCTGPG